LTKIKLARGSRVIYRARSIDVSVMGKLQATWIDEGRLFFWAVEGTLDDAVKRELPALRSLPKRPSRRQITVDVPKLRRTRIAGMEYTVGEMLPILASIKADAEVSDSVKCWSRAALLGLELAARQRVVPSVQGTDARWRAMLARRADVERYSAIVASLPPSSRAVPTQERGSIRLRTKDATVRAFIDRTVDSLYRGGAYPGTARGWSLAFAESLRGSDPAFQPRDARYQAMPARLRAWSSQIDSDAMVLAIRMHLPDEGGDSFKVSFWVNPFNEPEHEVPVDDAWYAGETLTLGDKTFDHPAHVTLRALARAGKLFPPIAEALQGPRPSALRWDASTAWRFLSEGRKVLQDAGYRVVVPDEFADAGSHRIRARIRLHGPAEGLALSEALDFRWEVTLGDRVIDGDEFTGLTKTGEPIAKYRGRWVLLDPSELARLPDGLPQKGQLQSAEALRAALVGWHQGVPVVVDDRLTQVLDALHNPAKALVPVGFRGRLRPYQKDGLAWMSTLGTLGLGACLADDMGLGKTVQLIAHILRRWERASSMNRRPSLVVCPTSVLGNWERELIRFAPGLGVLRYHGLHREAKQFKGADVVLTTYGLLVRDVDILTSREWDVVALDEAQAIKNPDSRRARAARKFKAMHRIAMSGTPIENRLDELWSLFEFNIPGLLGPRARFRRQVANPIERFGDMKMAERLKLGTSPFLMRRLKTDPNVIDDLPEKIERTHWTTLTAEQAQLYKDTTDAFMDRISSSNDMERRGQVLAMLTALKQVCNHPSHYLDDDGPLEGRSGKLYRTQHLLDAIVQKGERALVFTQYRKMGTRLQRYFDKRYKTSIPFLHGGTPQQGRDEMVRVFQEDEEAPPILLISLRAGGTGLNLTKATHVLHYDRWWNPAVEDQATDRAFRIGQKHNVMVHKMVAQGTLEERIDALLEEKRALAESVVGGSGERWVTELGDDALRALVRLGEDAVVEA